MRARTATILGSAVFHVLVGAAAVYYAGQPKPKKPHSVAVMGEKKPKPQDPPKPKEMPPPKPKLASREIAPAPEPTPMKETAPKPSHAPVSPGTMSNASASPGNAGGGGSGSGGGTGPATGDGTGGARPAVAAKKASGSPDDECTEAPTKASPANRATEIEYTQEARANGVEGRLVLKVVVGADGSVTDVIVVSSVDAALDAAAIAAVKTWTFKPAMRCGKPMAGGTYTLAQRFELGD